MDALRQKATPPQAMGLLLLGIVGNADWPDAPAMKLAIRLGQVDVAKLRKELEKKSWRCRRQQRPRNPPRKARKRRARNETRRRRTLPDPSPPDCCGREALKSRIGAPTGGAKTRYVSFEPGWSAFQTNIILAATGSAAHPRP